jgi:glycosyltransferase involved in cell wall biosynthesis
MPQVSVVCAVHNGERYLERSLVSVLDQSFADFELIVVDDGSTDRTPNILSSLLTSEPRARVVRQENRGLTASLNTGIDLSSGAYVARQDADDVSLPDRFARQVAYLEAHPSLAALGTGTAVIDEAGAVTGALAVAHGSEAVGRDLRSLRSTPVHGSMMMRRRAVQAIGGYREAFPVGQDYDLWLRLSGVSEIDNLPDTLYQWRLDPESVYGTRRTTQLRYAGVALAMDRERTSGGTDSYDLLESCNGDLERFVARYRLGPFVEATWGELLLRGVGNSADVRHHLRRALAGGEIRPWTLCLLGWTHLGLPWPGSRPLAAAQPRV